MILKTQTKYLGLIIDEQLTWSDHINILKKKLRRANGLLAKLRDSTSQNLLITICTMHFLPHIFYMALKYGANQKIK